MRTAFSSCEEISNRLKYHRFWELCLESNRIIVIFRWQTQSTKVNQKLGISDARITSKFKIFVSLLVSGWNIVVALHKSSRTLAVVASANAMQRWRAHCSPLRSHRTLFSMRPCGPNDFGVTCAGTHGCVMLQVPIEWTANAYNIHARSSRSCACACYGVHPMQTVYGNWQLGSRRNANNNCVRNDVVWYSFHFFLFLYFSLSLSLSLLFSFNATAQWQFTCSSRPKRTHTARTAIAEKFPFDFGPRVVFVWTWPRPSRVESISNGASTQWV